MVATELGAKEKGEKEGVSLISHTLKDNSGIMSDFLFLYLTSLLLQTCITCITFVFKNQM